MSSIAVRVLAGATLLGALLAAVLPVNTTNLPQRSRVVRLWVCTLDPGVVVTNNDLRILATLPNVRPGQRALVRARLDPLDDARNPGEPSERAIQGERGISGRLASVAILRIDRTEACPFSARLAALRASALDHLRTYLAEPGASIVAGELWGDRSAMSPQLRAEFQETGTVHVLVTAGLHVGLIAMLLLSLFSWLRIPRWIACVIVSALVWAFALFSGGNLPALRAASMATALLAARGFGRATLSWNTLALSAIFVLLIEPASVTSASFWLSFCCVGSIFALAPVITPMLERLSLPHRIQEAITLTLATQIGTWPITAAVFLQFSTYGFLANLFVVPLVPITMILGTLQLAASGVPPVAQAIANLDAWPLAVSGNLVQLLASLPAAAVPMSPAPTWCIAFYESSVLVAATVFRRGGPTAAVALMIVATSLVLAPPRAETNQLKITVLDVGQADSIVVETPRHHAIVIDAGGRLERGPQGVDSVAELVGERIVVPFLLRENIHALDALIISHPHGEHNDLQAHSRTRD